MKAIRLLAVGTCLLLLLLSCDKLQGAMKNVEGKVAGQVMYSSGHGRGYVTIKLVPIKDGEATQDVTEESGNFLIDQVTPGTYQIHILDAGGTEIPSDTPTVTVGPGRTMTVNVTLSDTDSKPST
jgi:hypothetical protein